MGVILWYTKVLTSNQNSFESKTATFFVAITDGSS